MNCQEPKSLKQRNEPKVAGTSKQSNNCSICLTEIDVVTVIFEGGVECKFFREELSNISEFFRVLLQGNFIEKTQEVIGLQHVDIDSFLTLLSCYKDKISWMEKLDGNDGGDPATSTACQQSFQLLKSSELQHNITDVPQAWILLELADMLGLQQAAAICDQYICQHINVENAEKHYLYASKFSRSAVTNEIIREVALSKFGKAIDRYCNLHLMKKEDVFLTLKNKPTSTSNIYILAKCFGPSNVSVDLRKIMTLEASHKRHQFTHSFYLIGGYNFKKKSNPSCWRIDSDAFVRHVQKESGEQSKLTKVAKVVKKPAKVFSNDNGKQSGLFEKLPSFPDRELEDYRIVAVGTSIYVIGGVYYENLNAADTTWIYDTREKRWWQGAHMKHKRCHHSMATLNNNIYVCGGYDGCSEVHSSAERYIAKKDVWIALPDMPIGVGNAASTGYRNSIYVICGQFGVKSIQTTRKVQEYNINTRQWSVPSEYNSPVFSPFSEYGLSCGVIGDEIYMVGGQTVRVDAYNMKSKTWRRRADMQHKRIDACTLTYRGRLLVVGGYEYDTGQYFDSTEVYNIETNSWSMLSSRIPISVKNVGLCYVFDVEKVCS